MVEEYEDDELADDSDDEKHLFKTEARAGRKLKAKVANRNNKVKFTKKPDWAPRLQIPGVFNSTQTAAGFSGALSQGNFGAAVQFQGQPGTSTLGPCFYCGKNGHFKKHCPAWAQLQTQLQACRPPTS